MPDDVTPATFQPLVGCAFRVSHADLEGEVSLELTTVRLDQRHPGAPREEPFTLLFVGPPGLEQNTYLFEQKELGSMDIFIVPIAAGEYEAVFN